MLLRNLQGSAVAVGQLYVFTCASTMPDGANCVDYVLREQPVPTRDLRVTNRATPKRSALVKEIGASRAMDSAVNTTPAQ
jgi:hypothetical protein